MSLNVRVGVGVFAVRADGKFIMGKRAGAGAPGEGTWSVPGGKMELGETIEAAGARELLEETGVVADKLKIVAVTCDTFETAQYVTIWLSGRHVSGRPEMREPEKFRDIGWYSLRNLPAPLFQPCWRNLMQTGQFADLLEAEDAVFIPEAQLSLPFANMG